MNSLFWLKGDNMKARIPHDFIRFLNEFSLESIIIKCSQLGYSVFCNDDKSFIEYRTFNFVSNGKCHYKKAMINQCFLIDIIYEAINNHSRKSAKIITDNDLYLLIALYNDYFNKFGLSKEYTSDDALLQAFGAFGEQKRMQRYHLFKENFAREYHILYNSSAVFSDKKFFVDTEKIINDNYGVDSKTHSERIYFLTSIFFIYSGVLKRDSIEDFLLKFDMSIKEDYIEKILDEYSICIEEVKSSSLGRQIFYSKPIIKENDYYIAVNPLLMFFLFENSNYWIGRNNDSQRFTNAFGEYFEEYVKELFTSCLNDTDFKRIERSNNEKRADWILTLNGYNLIIEQKSSLSAIGIKQQRFSLTEMKKHILKTWGEAAFQLKTTEESLKINRPLKIILLYEDYYQAVCIKELFRIDEEIENDGLYVLLTIRELEMLIYCYQNHPDIFNIVISNKMLNNYEQYGVSIERLLVENGFNRNEYLYKADIFNISDTVCKKTDDFINNLINKT